jgi:hypothetical protein
VHGASLPEFGESFNVAPQTFQPIIRLNCDSGQREIVLMRWSLIPFWILLAKSGYSSYLQHNTSLGGGGKIRTASSGVVSISNRKLPLRPVAGLRDRLKHKDARHHRKVREVTDKERLIGDDVFRVLDFRSPAR